MYNKFCAYIILKYWRSFDALLLFIDKYYDRNTKYWKLKVLRVLKVNTLIAFVKYFRYLLHQTKDYLEEDMCCWRSTIRWWLAATSNVITPTLLQTISGCSAFSSPITLKVSDMLINNLYICMIRSTINIPISRKLPYP